jgi:hypothetical protein
MTSNISTSPEKAANDTKPEHTKVAPGAIPPAVETQKKPQEVPQVKS